MANNDTDNPLQPPPMTTGIMPAAQVACTRSQLSQVLRGGAWVVGGYALSILCVLGLVWTFYWRLSPEPNSPTYYADKLRPFLDFTDAGPVTLWLSVAFFIGLLIVAKGGAKAFYGMLGGILGGVLGGLIFGVGSDAFRLGGVVSTLIFRVTSDEFRLQFFICVIIGAVSGAIAGGLQIRKFWLVVGSGFVAGLICASLIALICPIEVVHVRE